MLNRVRRTHHPLIETLVGLRGNERACVYTEPLWGIPHSLYIPFFTVYQHALGVSDSQIGALLSLGMVLQVLSSLIGGILTDRFGRRWITFVMDIVSWSVPVLIWALARDFRWFFVAALFNGLWQITNISWTCLMVEDCDQGKLVHIFTWCTICGLLSALFAPLSGLLVQDAGVVPAMRILLMITFFMMTVKFTILFLLSHETRMGVIKMRETRKIPILRQFKEYRRLAAIMFRTPGNWQVLSFLVLQNIALTVLGSFFALYATLSLGMPESNLALYPIGRALIMLVFIFTVQTVMNRMHFRIPMMAGLAVYIISHVILLAAPKGNPVFLWLYVICEAIAFALVVPQKDSLLVRFVDPAERPRIVSLINIIMIGFSAPFGWLAGELSQMNRSWPFILNIVLFAGCFLIVARLREKEAVTAPLSAP